MSKSNPKVPDTAAYHASELQVSHASAIPASDLFESYFVPDDPDVPLVDALDSLFLKNPATFHYGNQHFRHLRKNTRIPEVCILGRSNVGKSSLINALANRRGRALARVSAKAGHTRAMNLYGFGPPPHPAALLAADAEAKRKKYEQVTYEEDFVTVMNVTRRVDVLAEAGDVFRFGRNEIGNQNLHTWIDKLLG